MNENILNLKPKIKILIVEDEALIAKDIKQKLFQLGHEVVGIVDNGDEAIAIARKNMPHILLMDIVIKGSFNGIETAQRIKENQKVAVIYLTAFDSPSVATEADSTNPQGYLLKPFDDSMLQNVVLELQIEKAFEE